ncbi:MAG: family 10 glycosylhydrolase [Clostridia bacterium]|nr:family 10 glycosylhydrolase [Clostridia bacterium]
MLKFKRILAVICCLFLLPSCAVSNQNEDSQTEAVTCDTPNNEQIRAMWLSCYELSEMFEKGTREYFSDKVCELFEVCKIKNINTLFVQVRPFCDSLYPSEIFEWSKFAESSSGTLPNFDPLEIIVDTAADYGVSVHAWINPYRVSYDSSAEISKAIEGFAFSCEEGVFLDPSSVEAQKQVLEGVREILENYDVDGIHIDDYFYPQTDNNFDKAAYEAYLDCGGKLSKNDWRRENVNSLVSALYSLVHSAKTDAVFSISPAGDIRKNKTVHFADVELWCTVKGYADWIVPQIYYGFEHEKMPFKKIADKWLKLAEKGNVKIICGLASYKQGKADNGAGSGENEWVNDNDVISGQTKYINSIGYGGYALFSYSYVKKIK